jgi:hypothetical protein
MTSLLLLFQNLRNQCFCGTDSNIWGATKATNCDMKCSGDSSAYCGGFNAMSVYRTDSDSTSLNTK